MSHTVSRRALLRSTAMLAGASALAGCAPKVVEKVVKETVVVAGTPQVVEREVTAVPTKVGNVVLSYLVVGGGVRDKLYGESVDRFNKANGPGLTVKMEPLVGNDEQVQQKILTMIAAGTVPDVVHVDTMFINQLAPTGVLLPLDDMPGAKELFDAIWPGAMAPLIIDGKTWAVPIRANSVQYYYNKDMAKEAGLDPETPPVYLSDLTEWAAKMTKKDATGQVECFGYDYKFSNKNASWTLHAWYPLIWGYKGRVLDDNGRAAFNGDAGIKALQWWVDLKKAQYAPESSIDNGLEFKKVASTITGEWEIYHLKNEVGLNLGVARFPYPEGGEHAIPLGGRTLVIYKANPHPELAWKLIQHVMSKEEQMFVTKGMGGLTPRRDVLDDPWWDQNPEYKLTLLDMEFVRPKDATPYFMQLIDIMLRCFQRAILEGMPPAESLNQAAAEFNALVEGKK
ncbi:MAG: ABC transporter substrate-binding protein [Armatimonadetes bacterium]|nr:ABC transporter substrate-binding protein [Armatimonadota bacterium]